MEYISLSWYSSFYNFLDRGLLSTRKLLNLGFLVHMLKLSRLRHYRCLHSLVSHYWLYVPHMTTDFVTLSHNFPIISYFMAHYPIYSMTGATWKAEKYNPPGLPPVFCGVCIAQSLVFCVGLTDHCPFSDWIMYCLPFKNLHLLLTTLVSSNVSVVVFALLDLWTSL